MLQHSHCYVKLGKELTQVQCSVLSSKDIETIERDLMAFVDSAPVGLLQSIALVGGIEYGTIDELRQAMTHKKVIMLPWMEHDVITSYLYSLYRALHDIIHHGMNGLDFTFDGEAKAYELMVIKLQSLGASDVTIAFVRDDILYINAMYHYSRKADPKASKEGVILLDCTVS